MRRYQPMRRSMGTVWPEAVRQAIYARDKSCIGPLIGMAGPCFGSAQIDHVRASHATGRKSESTVSNGALTCSEHHRLKTEYGKVWRPKILDYIAKRDRAAA